MIGADYADEKTLHANPAKKMHCLGTDATKTRIKFPAVKFHRNAAPEFAQAWHSAMDSMRCQRKSAPCVLMHASKDATVNMSNKHEQ